MRTLFASLALGLTLTTSIQAQEWDIDPSASELTFSVVAFETPLTGAFDIFDAEITLDPNNLADASIRATVSTGSGKVSDPSFQDTFASRWGLSVETHPEAIFISDSIIREGELYRASGDLTIKGKTIPVTLPFSLEITEGRAVADGTFEIDRRRFDVGTEWDEVDDLVSVRLHIEADAVGSF